MKVKKFYIETYGCQMNVADSEVVAAILEDKGYQRTQEKSEADVILAVPYVKMRNNGFADGYKDFPR